MDHADHILKIVRNVLIKLGLNIVPHIPPTFTNAYLALVREYSIVLNTYYSYIIYASIKVITLTYFILPRMLHG